MFSFKCLNRQKHTNRNRKKIRIRKVRKSRLVNFCEWMSASATDANAGNRLRNTVNIVVQNTQRRRHWLGLQHWHEAGHEHWHTTRRRHWHWHTFRLRLGLKRRLEPLLWHNVRPDLKLKKSRRGSCIDRTRSTATSNGSSVLKTVRCCEECRGAPGSMRLTGLHPSPKNIPQGVGHFFCPVGPPWQSDPKG